MKILFTPTGRRQFLEAIAYIHRDDASVAIRFRENEITLDTTNASR